MCLLFNHAPAEGCVYKTVYRSAALAVNKNVLRQIVGKKGTGATMAAEDRVCLAMAHSAFDHAMAWLLKHTRLLMDATGATRHLNGDKAHVVRLGDGNGIGE